MNKKQLIVAWVSAIIICISWLSWSDQHNRSTRTLGYRNPESDLIATNVIVLVIGGLLTYTLRDKKK
ncbi:MAG: hypothetical protein Q8L26_01705 [Candidatus Omnitrophota bacterium]|nr:hypothetical protein [Candidatus Omnitrophota bacterium]